MLFRVHLQLVLKRRCGLLRCFCFRITWTGDRILQIDDAVLTTFQNDLRKLFQVISLKIDHGLPVAVNLQHSAVIGTGVRHVEADSATIKPWKFRWHVTKRNFDINQIMSGPAVGTRGGVRPDERDTLTSIRSMSVV